MNLTRSLSRLPLALAGVFLFGACTVSSLPLPTPTPSVSPTARATATPRPSLSALPSGAVTSSVPATRFVATPDRDLATKTLSAVNAERTKAGKPACTVDAGATKLLGDYLEGRFPSFSYEKPVTELIDFNAPAWTDWRGVFSIDLADGLRNTSDTAPLFAKDRFVGDAARTSCVALAYQLPDNHAFVGIWTK